jgi:hypothetical protein
MFIARTPDSALLEALQGHGVAVVSIAHRPPDPLGFTAGQRSVEFGRLVIPSFLFRDPLRLHRRAVAEDEPKVWYGGVDSLQEKSCCKFKLSMEELPLMESA